VQDRSEHHDHGTSIPPGQALVEAGLHGSLQASQSVSVTGHSRHVSRVGSHGTTFACATAPSDMRPSGETSPPARSTFEGISSRSGAACHSLHG